MMRLVFDDVALDIMPPIALVTTVLPERSETPVMVLLPDEEAPLDSVFVFDVLGELDPPTTTVFVATELAGLVVVARELVGLVVVSTVVVGLVVVGTVVVGLVVVGTAVVGLVVVGTVVVG
jgi:hypothetical protein